MLQPDVTTRTTEKPGCVVHADKRIQKYAVSGYMTAYECVTLSHIQQTGLSPVRSLADNVIEQFYNTTERDGCVTVEEY